MEPGESWNPDPADPLQDRYTDRARKVMQLANQEAQHLYHEQIGTEHILLGLIKEGSGVAAHVLKKLGADVRAIRREVEAIIPKGRNAVTPGRLALTPRAKMVIKYSMDEARNLNHNYVGTEHIILGLLREEEGVAARVLVNFGLRLEGIRAEVMAILGPPGSGQPSEERDETVEGWFGARRRTATKGIVQCHVPDCNRAATFRLTYAERGTRARQEQLCEPHAEDAVVGHKSSPGPGVSAPAVLGGAKQFAISLVIETDAYELQWVLLSEVGAQRQVPIPAGAVGASDLEQKLTGRPSPSPSTHEATAAIIRACGAEVRHAIVDRLEQHTYYARLRVERGSGLTDIEMQPADAFLLALAFDRPIFVSDTVLDKLERS